MSVSEPTTVLLADDHPGILAAVSKYLEQNGIDVVARAKDGHEALRQIQETQPTIALLDVRMPGMSGVELTRLAAHCSPLTSVILFSGYGSRGQVVEALDAGARGFLLKNLALAEVLRAIQVVSRGGTYVDATLTGTLDIPVDAPTLTHRDRDVLRLLASGERYEEIGRDLFVSTATVRKIMFKVKTELGAATATQAVAAALRHSLIA
jgi:DNA-binding NarL/FixJ family response regulator